jgi:hypothetical protein
MAATSGPTPIISAMEKLRRTILALSDVTRAGSAAMQNISAAVSLRGIIKNTTSDKAMMGALSNVIKRGLGGKQTQTIVSAFGKAQQARKQFRTQMKVRQKATQKLVSLRAQQATQTPGSAAWNRSSRKIYQAINQKFQAQKKARSAYGKYGAALGRARTAALGKGTKLPGMMTGALSKGLAAFGVAVKVATVAFEFFDGKIKESSQIVEKFGKYSIGGLQALYKEQIGDFRRDIRISQKSAAAMNEFAEANQRMKNAFEPTAVALNKITLKLGTMGANLFATMAPAINVFSTSLAKADDYLAQFGAFMVGGPAGFAAEVKRQQDRDAALLVGDANKSQRRSKFFGGDMAANKAGDLHPEEEQFGQIAFGVNPLNPNQPLQQGREDFMRRWRENRDRADTVQPRGGPGGLGWRPGAEMPGIRPPGPPVPAPALPPVVPGPPPAPPGIPAIPPPGIPVGWRLPGALNPGEIDINAPGNGWNRNLPGVPATVMG